MADRRRTRKAEGKKVNYVLREVMEEIAATLGPLYSACAIESDAYGTAQKDLTYMLILAGRVETLCDMEDNGESLGREIVSPETFLDRYTAGDKELMRGIVESALRVIQ